MARRYRLIVAHSVHKALSRIPLDDQRRLAEAIDSLSREPRPDGCKKLRGLHGIYRIRVGSYRILYLVSDRELTVTVTLAARRSSAYRKVA